jgi:hypothetical protein
LTSRALLGSMATCLALIAGAAKVFGGYATRHFLPEQRMEHAVGAGAGCVLTLGDSRMDAATDVPVLRSALRDSGQEPCVASLALGATDISGMALTAEEYVRRGGRPRLAVIGKVGDSLLGNVEEPESAAGNEGGPRPVRLRPEDMGGNNAIHLIWSRPGDVFEEVPGFPWANIDAFDAGLRFLVLRATPLGRYQSMTSAKTQAFASKLTGGAAEPRNRFGALGDMARLEDALEARAADRLAAAMQAPPDVRLGAWFGRLARFLRDHDVPFVVVELPARRAYREHVDPLPQYQAYQGWLKQELPRWKAQLVELSPVDETYFVDALHLGPAGATLVSTELGRRLAPILRR